MGMSIRGAAGFILAVVALCGIAVAGQPPRFNWQGKLTDSSGVPLQGSHTFYFKMFQGGTAGAANSGLSVFEESAALNAQHGVVNHTVGTGSAQAAGAFAASMLRFDGDIFLQVAVDIPNNVVLPRSRIESVPFSIVSADGEVRIPLSQPATFPIEISVPGSYYLTQDITGVSGLDGINITTGGVTIDLNGFNLLRTAGATGTNTAVKLQGIRSRVRVLNGSIVNWGHGVFGDQSTACEVRDVAFQGMSSSAVQLGNNALIQNCSVRLSDFNSTAIYAGQGSRVENCRISDNENPGGGAGDSWIIMNVGDHSTVTGNIVTNNDAGGGSSAFYAILASSGCMITGNTVLSNGAGSVAGDYFGIYTGGSSLIKDNISSGGTGGDFAYGIQAGDGSTVIGNTCNNQTAVNNGTAAGIVVSLRVRVENNNCSAQAGLNAYGILMSASGCKILKNTTSGNSDAGIRTTNASGASYIAENVCDEGAVSQSDAVNVMGLGDRSNVSF
jgi:hypothetical protein